MDIQSVQLRRRRALGIKPAAADPLLPSCALYAPSFFIMMLSSAHLHLITDLLDDKTSTLEALADKLRQAVPNKSDHFGICSALYMLLVDDLLISPLQKIVAYYLLFILHPVTLETNPFFPSFLAVFENAYSPVWEFNYCSSFLNGPSKEVRKLIKTLCFTHRTSRTR